jgi:hypothetical protein
MRKTRQRNQDKHRSRRRRCRTIRQRKQGGVLTYANANQQFNIPMTNQNIARRIPINPTSLHIQKPRLRANNAPLYAQLWESGDDLDTLLGTLTRMELPEEQHDRLLRRLAFNLQPGVLAPHIQKIYDGLVWLELSAEEFQEAVEGYDISESEKDELMDFFLWDQLVRTL